MDESKVLVSALEGAPGTLLEVGAHVGDSSLIALAEAGWSVHAFEPDPTNRAELEQNVAHLSNVTVIPKAAADKPGTMTLYTSEQSTGISSLTPFTDHHTPSVDVEVVTLRDYIAEQSIAKVDYLKMDVEGYERFVLDGYPWETHKPRAIMLEFEDLKTVPIGYTWEDLANTLAGHGYAVFVSEWKPIVKYGVQHQFRRFTRYPTTLADPAAWGNLIAVSAELSPRVERLGRAAALRNRAADLLSRAS